MAPDVLIMAASGWVTVLQIFFLIAAILLCFIILIQPGKGEGIASAFAGVGSDSFFGTKAGQSMSRITIVLSVIVLVLGIFINVMSVKPTKDTEKNGTPPPAEEVEK